MTNQPSSSTHSKGQDALPIKIQIGPYKLYSIKTGTFSLDGGAMFGTVPKTLWSQKIEPDELNRIPMEARVLLLRSDDGKKNILIDTGNGSDFIQKHGQKLGSKFASLFNIQSETENLTSSLSEIGLSADQITHVILTHLHFDHSGGATSWNGAELVPTFKNALYYVQKDNLDNALNPNIREKASYLKPNFEPLLKFNKLITLDHQNTIEGLDFIYLLPSHGHTKGQQNVMIDDGNTSVFYGADLIPTHAHIRLAWTMGYDIDPVTLIDEKQILLKMVSQKKGFLFFEHDPYYDMATVTANDQGDYSPDQVYIIQK